MSTEYDDDFDMDDEDNGSDIRNLRKAAKAAKRLQSELQQVKRELAFAKAGLPLDDPKMNYFVKGYDGEMDAEAIREAALAAGFIAQPQAEVPAQAPEHQAAVAAQQRVMAASAGAVSEDVSEAAALSRMEAAMSEGGLEAMLEIARQYGIPTHIDE